MYSQTSSPRQHSVTFKTAEEAVETEKADGQAHNNLSFMDRQNIEYIKTVPGAMRLIRLVCHFIGFIAVSASSTIIAYSVGYVWAKYVYQFYAVYGFLIAGVVFWIFFMELNTRTFLSRLDWITFDAFYCFEMFLIFFILSISCCLWEKSLAYRFIIDSSRRVYKGRGGPGIAAFFGFIASLTYMIELIWKYVKITRG